MLFLQKSVDCCTDLHTCIAPRSIISCILMFKNDLKYHSFNLIFSRPLSISHFEMNVDKCEIKFILYCPKIPEDSDEYRFKYLTNCLKLKVCVINGHLI